MGMPNMKDMQNFQPNQMAIGSVGMSSISAPGMPIPQMVGQPGTFQNIPPGQNPESNLQDHDASRSSKGGEETQTTRGRRGKPRGTKNANASVDEPKTSKQLQK